MNKDKSRKIRKVISILILILITLIIFIVDRWHYSKDTRAYVEILNSSDYPSSAYANNVLTYITYEQLPLKYKMKISENDYNNARNEKDILAIYQKLDQTAGTPVSITPGYYTTFDGKTPQVISQIQYNDKSYWIYHYIEFAPPSLFKQYDRVLKWSVRIEAAENY